MKIYTYHMKPGATPLEAAIAVPEAFSWAAFLFGAVWALYLHRHRGVALEEAIELGRKAGLRSKGLVKTIRQSAN